jgi:two-component system, LytTR family, response regulator
MNDLRARDQAINIRTLIVDDQLIPREALRRMLQHEPNIEVVGVCAGGQEAVRAINELSPDLVLLDAQMPEVDGFDVVARINPARMPAIIFVTAHDSFALKAFEAHALDYLMKPCDVQRLRKSLERVRDQIRRRETGELNNRLLALLDDLKAGPKTSDRLAVKSSGRVLFLKFDEIDWVEAADNYLKLHASNEAHLVRDTMNAMEKKLPADKFLRIGRSTIVNFERVKELQPMFHGDYAVILRDGTRLTLSRNYRDKLEQLGLG